MSYLIGYLASKPVQDYYEELTTELASNFGVRNLKEHVAAHITLIYPFESATVEEVESRIEAHLLGKSAIPFTISGYARFSGRKGTIYMDVVPNSDVQLFADTFAKTFKDLNPDRRAGQGIVPHLSIARFLNDEKHDRIWEYVHTRPLPHFEVLFDNVTLFSYRDDRWHVRRVFPCLG